METGCLSKLLLGDGLLVVAIGDPLLGSSRHLLVVLVGLEHYSNKSAYKVRRYRLGKPFEPGKDLRNASSSSVRLLVSGYSAKMTQNSKAIQPQ